MLAKKLFGVIVVGSMLVLTSCVDNGPKGNCRMPDRTIDETVEDVLEAQETGWLYEYDVELYYRDNGEWVSAGMFSVYQNMSQDAEPDNKWVDFGESFYFPSERTDYAGYSRCVTYQGIKLYW